MDIQYKKLTRKMLECKMSGSVNIGKLMDEDSEEDCDVCITATPEEHGIVDGTLSQEVMWKCQYEQALIQPVREVLDIYMNEYAAGGRSERC